VKPTTRSWKASQPSEKGNKDEAAPTDSKLPPPDAPAPEEKLPVPSGPAGGRVVTSDSSGEDAAAEKLGIIEGKANPWKSQAGGRGSGVSDKGKGYNGAISARGHTTRGRLRQKSHKSAELVSAGTIR
jgi:hypothetical protein